jgi:hypothetical protein
VALSKKLFVLGVFALVALALVAAAGASPTPTMPVVDTGPYLDGTDQAGFSLGPETLATTSRCRTAQAFRKYHSVAGYDYYIYWESVSWCYDPAHGVIKSAHRNRWVSCCNALWTFDGNISSNCSLEHCDNRGVGAGAADVMSQGQFHVCLGALGLNICRTKTPKIDISYFGSGYAYASTSG